MTNPFLLSEIEDQQPAQSANPFSLQAIQNDQQQDLRVNLQRAVRENPDAAAEAANLAKRYPAPVDVLARNLMDVKLQAAVDKADERLRTSPKLAEALRTKPWLTQQSHDDIPPLSAVEQVFNVARSVPAGAARGLGGIASGTGELLDIGARATGLSTLSRLVREATGIDPNVALDVAGSFKVLGKGGKAIADAIGVDPANRNFATDVGEGIGQLLQQIGVQIATGGTASLTTLFAQGADAMATKTEKDNASQAMRDTAVLTGSAITALTEKYGVDALLNRVPPAIKNNALRWVADKLAAGGIEATQEITEGALQDLVRVALTNPNADIGDGALYEGGVAATSAAIVRAALGVRVRSNVEIQRANEAQQHAQKLQEAMTAASQSKLRERNPETFRDLAASLTDNTVVYVDAQVLAQSATELAEALPAVAAQLENALASNSTVEVPIADILTLASGTPLEQVFLQNARQAPDALSLADTQAAAEQGEAFIAQEAERVLQQAQDQSAWQQSSESVKTTILDQLNTAGRFTPDVNEAYATLQMNFFSTMAARLGVTPQELYDRYALKVAAKQVGQGGVLNEYDQQGNLITDTPEFQNWFGESQVRDADGRPTRYYIGMPGEMKGDALRPNPLGLIFTTPDTNEANAFAIGNGANVLPVYVKAENPFDPFNESHLAAVDAYPEDNLWDSANVENQDTIAKIKAAGFDGLYVKDRGSYQLNLAVFNPNQIKSAIGNSGAFNPNDPNILNQRGVQEKGKVVPAAVDATANVESAFAFAATQSFPTNRDFKLAIQARVIEAAKAAKVKLDEFTQGTEQYLVRVALSDGLTALRTNANAVGWYNEKVTKALRLVSLIHPEIATDPQAKFAFVWAMAVTSNGLKVDKNFELAEKVYQGYKKSSDDPALRRMPTNIGIGTAAGPINKTLGLYNILIQKNGFEAVEKFMTTMQTVKQVEEFTGQKVSGENLTTQVYGAAALGPKIGNGFFMNLYGRFEQLTMDRWLMRTWGRWTGTLVESNPAQVKAKRTLLKGLIQSLTPADKKAFEAIIKRKLTVGDVDAVGQAIWKASQKPANRKAMAAIGMADDAMQARFVEMLGEPKKGQARVSVGDELRKAGNAVTKYLDGQKEAPAGPPERGNIRKVFGQVLAELQKTYPALTMSDLQALLWYPEKRLYDAAKTSDEATDGYEDDEAPDYANAAAKLARSQGIPDADIAAASAAVDAELQAAVGAAGARPGERGPGRLPSDAAPEVLNQSVGFDQTQTEAFKRYSNDAPLVTSDAAETYDFKTGEKIVLESFHGTKRPDRVGTKFLKKRATSGPMAYHTSSPLLASSYATGKEDTSLSEEDQNFANWFKYKPQGQRTAVDIVRAWYFLDAETKAKITETAPTLRLNDDMDGVVSEEGNTGGNGSYDYNLSQTRTAYDRRGNPLKALVEDWLSSGNLFNEEELFMEVLQKAGFPMKEVTYDSPTAQYPFVYKNYITMQKPLVTSDIPQEVVDALNAAAKTDRSRAKTAGADFWDKNTRTLRDWVAEFNKADNKYVWTSIPDKVTDVFRSLGYDGIVDWSGKGGGTQFPVYIPFEETQVKSALGNKGKFDTTKNDILNQGPRGTFSPEQLLLTLNENADLSTFLHESGHFFLEVMADLASQSEAPQQIRDDMKAVLQWFGVRSLATWNQMTLDEKRPYHERWAESFEQYLFEGKAPSAELQPLFRRFRSWLVNVYKSLTQFMRDRNLKLNDEVRQVFDRMIATDEQIAQAEQAAGMLPDFEATNEAIEQLQARSLRDLKWTVKARGKALKALEKEAKTLRDAVEVEVRAEVAKQPLYAAMNWLRKGEMTNEAGEQVKAEKGFRLNTQALAEMYPESMLARPELARLKGMTVKDGLHPDLVADMFGFESGDALVSSIIDAEPIASVIEGMTDQRMLERHGDLATPEAREAAANEAVHNEARARSLATELKSQAEMLNPRQAKTTAPALPGTKAVGPDGKPMLVYHGTDKAFDTFDGGMFTSSRGRAENYAMGSKGRVLEVYLNITNPMPWAEAFGKSSEEIKAAGYDGTIQFGNNGEIMRAVVVDAAQVVEPVQNTATNGRAITVNAITAAAKQFAENLAARRRLKDLKNATWQHRSAEARAGKAWQAATAKGDTQAAVQAKRDQVLNNATVKALQDAQAEVKKIIEFFKRVTKGNDEKIVERGRDPDVVNAMRAILGAYDIAPRLEKSALAYMETVGRNDPAMYAALKPSVDAAMLNAKPLTEMTVEELRGLTDELRAMWALAKRSRQMEVDGNLMDIEDAADELVNRMGEIGIPAEIPGEKGAITDKQERGIKLQFAKAILTRVEQWSERLDGKFGGPFLRLVFQPIKDAADRYRTAKVDYRKQFTELLQKVAPSLPAGPIGAPEIGYTFGNARDSGAAELLHAILHTGNDSNKRKLLLGRGWATENADGTLDTSKWDAFITRMHAEGKLNQAHYDFAQGVWNLLEQMKPLAQETHRNVFGRYFAEVTANEVVTPFGTYRGGYVPAQTDSRLVKDAKLRELAEGENESMAYAFPAAPSGFTKSRVEYNQPLLLDLRALAQHMDKVLLFSHMQGAVTDVRRLLTSKRVSYALDRIDPSAYEGMLIPWLNSAAKQVVETPVLGDRKLSRFLSAGRSRSGMSLMFANLSNTVQQITGFSLAAVKVKPGLMMSAAAQFAADPKAMRKAVVDASPYMQYRMLDEVGAMNDAVEQILVNPTLLERGQVWTQRHAYFLQAAVDNTMSPIIWTAAYNQGIQQGMDAKEAVRFADGVVRQTQGTTLPEDVSRFETGPAYARLFTQFVSYFNMMANTNATAMKQIVDEMGVKKGAGKLLYVALTGLLVPIWVAEAIAQAFRGGPEDEDDDGWLDDWLAAVFGMGTLRGLVAQVPLAGQLAQLVVNRFNDNPADDKFSLSPAVSLIESAVSSPASVYNAIVEDGNKQKAVRDVAAAATLITGLPFFAAARPVGYLAGMAGGSIEPTGPADLARGLVTGTASPESKQR